MAAVCVYGDLAGVAREALAGTGIHVAAVATAFPSGRASRAVKIADVKDAVANGADEIDMVIDRGAFLAGRYLDVYDEIVAVKEACGDAHLKVILETGELVTLDNVRRASWLAMLAGGDFIKTSTGKISPAATLPVCLVMLEAVRDFRAATGRQIGVKPAGGIRTTKDAIKHLVLVNETAGPDWLDPDWFRFGASSLLNDLLLQRQKLAHRPLLRPRLRDGGLTRMTMPSPTSPSSTPPPPSRGRSSTSRRPTACSSTASSSTAPASPSRRSTRPPRRSSPRSPPAATADVDRAVAAARRAFTRVWGPMRPADRGKYLFRIARLLQERAREFAVLESLDNGKPIRESRDVDVPLAAAHFFYHAGWADKLDYAGPRRRTRGRSAWPARSSRGTSRC